jgi:hypothetical protein
VAPSAIAHEEANLGCFVTCESASRSTQHLTHMTFPPGVFLDIGVYGRVDDCLSNLRHLCKNFVHSNKVSTYSFGKYDDIDETEMYDVCDNVVTGQLKETARRNVLPYVNETDGSKTDIACVIAEHDPTQQVSADLHDRYHGCKRC